MNYVLGLDLGISSVGWAVLDQEKLRIADLGVRAFSAAEVAKTKAPLAEARRIARGARRRLRRRAVRMSEIKDLLVARGFVAEEALSERPGADGRPLPPKLFTSQSRSFRATPWELRSQGLDRVLTGDEFAIALLHISKRRGFQSNRLTEKAGGDDGKVTTATEENRKIRQEKGYRTVGEMVATDEQFAAHKRNQYGDYSHCVTRGELRGEIEALFAAQRSLGSPFAGAGIEAEFVAIWERQRPFSSGSDIIDKVGRCELDRTEKRAPKNSYTAELCVLLQKINNLSWYAGHKRAKPDERQRAAIRECALTDCEISHKKLFKLLGLKQEDRFTGLTYKHKGNDLDRSCETAKFCNMVGLKEIKRIAAAVGADVDVLGNPDRMDDIAYGLTFYKNDTDLREYLESKDVPECVITHSLGSAGFRTTMNLSIKAARAIMPFLEQGFVYSDACEMAGYNHSRQFGEGPKLDKLPPFDPDEVRNPVVLRTLTQARKVVNAVIDRYGAPTRIHIELGRDLGKGPKVRAEIEARNNDRRSANDRSREQLKEIFKSDPTGEALAKFRLYKDQSGQCAYTLTPITIERLNEPGYVEIDHIAPWSRSYDNSYGNKVLVLTSENRQKGHQTPFEYFGHEADRWSKFEAWVAAAIHDPRKRSRLLSQELPATEVEDGWMPRNLIDTQWAGRLFADHARRHLKFADDSVKVPVICVSGSMTSMLRGVWRVSKVREENDLHHAKDACVVAAITQRTIGLMTRFRQRREVAKWTTEDEYVDADTGEIVKLKHGFPLPWQGFSREIEARLSGDPAGQIGALVTAGKLPGYADGYGASLSQVIVSRMPQRKVSGQMHKETIRSQREDESGRPVAVTRKRLVELSAGDLGNLVAPETNEKLYDAIAGRMAQFGNNAKKAFGDPANPLRKPTNDGSDGQIVKAVRVAQAQPSGTPIRGGVADNGEMIRIDVFTKSGKFYVVPIYSEQFLKGVLPNQAMTAGKSETEWLDIRTGYEFLHSLYPFDLVRITDSNNAVRFGYYRSADRSTGSVTISAPNKNDELTRGIGMRTARSVETFEIGVLGDIHVIGKETRRGVANGRHIEPREIED